MILIYTHLASIIPVAIIGVFLLLNTKGTPRHKTLGLVYVVLILFSAVITLFISAQVGPTIFGHFGYIHLFSFLVLYCIPSAYFNIKKGNVSAHKKNMLGVYIGGILIAGAFTLTPGRLLHSLIFGA